MQVEASYPKYAGRVPPLDLSQVNAAQELWAAVGSGTPTTPSSKRHHHHHQHQHHPYHHVLDKCRGGVSLLSSDDHNNNRLTMTGLGSGDDIMMSPTTSLMHPMGSDGLPLDPRDWTRADVWKWLINMAVSEGLEVTPELPQKFPMNGKALCLMSLDMYLCRVPVGGKMLYRDFRVRLARAMAVLS
ncbi:uncharacterized protein LOC117891310 [Drosophila subobscura]|uniref:uncharacterized protein LOC117891310 n=1 Tax=Drosophila subobscura TaxID=7241 RepID=UPI00155A3A19|nr:uncharacterized protein LOC117891310 [Drosophila subobscura]